MSNKIYIVAGERNMKLAHQAGGGLWANVGQTSRQVSDRLRDDDYKRKAAGGLWKILYQQEVGDLSDKEIHPLLKAHPRVIWENSNNTEEFLFLDDSGDGAEASRIVKEILSSRCVPLLVVENERLHREVASLENKLAIVDDVIGHTGVDVEKIMTLLKERDDLSARLKESCLKESKLTHERDELNLFSKKQDAEVIRLKSKVKNQMIFFAILAMVVLLAGRFWADKSHLEDLAKAYQERDVALSMLSTSDTQLKDLQAKMEAIQKIEDEKKIKNKKRSSKKKVIQEADSEGGVRPGIVAHAAAFESCIYKADTSIAPIDFIMKCNVGNEVAMKKCLMTDTWAPTGNAELSTASFCWKKTHP